MAALTHRSHKAINDIINEMTRPITEILGEPPLTPLEPRHRKRSRPVPPRSLGSPSDAEIIAITTSYNGPESFLKGGRLSAELCPPRKSRRIEPSPTDSTTKKRRREDKPPRHADGAKKREGVTLKKPRTDDVKPRPPRIKLTSQPRPRETNEDTKKKIPRSLANPARRKAESIKEPRKQRSASNESPGESSSSPEQRRPRSRAHKDEGTRNQEREQFTSRRDKPRVNGSGRDRESGRERPDRDRDSERRSSLRTEREKDRAKVHRSKTDRRVQDGERERQREDTKPVNEPNRSKNDHAKGHGRDKHQDIERPVLRSKPSPGWDSSSAEQSPYRSRGASLSLKPMKQNGKSPTKNTPVEKVLEDRHGVAELQKSQTKQKELEREYEAIIPKIEDLWKKKDYDGYEVAAKQGFCLSFNLGLAMETELRLSATTVRVFDGRERATRKRRVIDHYKSLTKNYTPKRMQELNEIGRKEASAFYKRGIQKVYFRMFLVHNLKDRDVQQGHKSLQVLLQDTIKDRLAGKSNRSAEEEIPMRKLENLGRLVHDHINILSILEGSVADVGLGFEDAGAESYVLH